MATHASILTWEIPRTEKPGRLAEDIATEQQRHQNDQ